MKDEYLPEYMGTVFFVEDVEKSKEFYIDKIGLTIEMDFGRCINFEKGLSIWDREYALNMMNINDSQQTKDHNAEMYFESNDLDKLYDRINNEEIVFIHELIEQPWGQRCFRIYDPDNHIIEFGEPMEAVIQRLKNQGRSIDEIQKKTMMPLEFIQKVFGE